MFREKREDFNQLVAATSISSQPKSTVDFTFGRLRSAFGTLFGAMGLIWVVLNLTGGNRGNRDCNK
jgi:hypothetical protein